MKKSDLKKKNATGHHRYMCNFTEINGHKEVLAVLSSFDFFQPQNNTAAIEEVFISTVLKTRRKKEKQKLVGSRLDAEWIPNWITQQLRKG